MEDKNIINFIKKCSYCNKIIPNDAIIYFIYDNPTCSRDCKYFMIYEINRRDPTLSLPELWTEKKSRSKSF